MPATGQVQYGKTTAYGTSTTPETSFNYSTHVQAISGLSAGTLYHFRVSSTNAGGATATSGDQTFTTPAAPPAPTPTPVPTPSPTPVPTPVPTPAPTPAPPVGGSSTCTRNVNVDSSGNTDVTSSLQAFVDGSPNGSVICFASGGQYRVNGTLKLINRSNITLEGNNATIFQTTRSTGKILLIDNGGQDITVRNLTIKGANPNPGKWDLTYEHNHAIHIGGTLRVDLDHLTIKNIGGDALYIMGGYLSGGGFRFADSIRFHNSVVDGTGRMGLAITDGATNVSFDHNTLSRIAYYTFDVEPNGYTFNGQAAGAVGVKFTDNTIGTKPYGDYPTDRTQADGYLFAATGTSGGGPAVDIEIARNTMTDPTMGALKIGVFNNGGARQNIRVVDNTAAATAAGPVMSFNGVSGLTITGNRQKLSSGSLASTSGCSGGVMSGNITN